MTPDPDELLPCPGCESSLGPWLGKPDGTPQVSCSTCGFRGPYETLLVSAVGRWNAIPRDAAIRDLSAQVEALSTWSDISSAPRDGTWIWVFIPGVSYPKGKSFRKTSARQMSARWVQNPQDGKGFALTDHAKALRDKHGGFWSSHSHGRKPIEGLPTHWRPLMAPPEGYQ